MIQNAEEAAQAPRAFTVLRGVRTHNLKNIHCAIPQGQLTVVTGLSGSGKSSLAFETLYAEGQRRYTASLSTYARQFLEQMERPAIDSVRSIQPAIALKQHNEVNNARSTVGTVTEINDFLELIFTHIGQTTCPSCQRRVRRDTVATGVEAITSMPERTRLILVAEVQAERPEHRPLLLQQLVQEGYSRLYVEGQLWEVEQAQIERLLDLEVFPVVVDRLISTAQPDAEQRMRLSEAVEAAFALGKGRALLIEAGQQVPGRILDRGFRCECGRAFIEPQPALFSFNSSLGACAACSGFGKTVGVDYKKVIPNDMRTLQQGAIAPLESEQYASHKAKLLRWCQREGVPIDVPYRKLTEEHRRQIRQGAKGWSGLKGFFETLQTKQYKTHVRVMLARYRGYDECETCQGTRLSEDARCVRVGGRLISEFWAMRLDEASQALRELSITAHERAQVQLLLDEILHRLDYLGQVGLGYLTLDRQSRTLSGGEMQRIHLTTSLGRALTDTLYVLDEPTAGLHARDSGRLLEVLYRLRDLGNTVVVVEHDPEIIEGADHVMELGPGAGERGGELVFEGPLEAFVRADTLTAQTLSRRLVRPAQERPQGPQGSRGIWIRNAREHNLEGVDAFFPYEALSALTGVSGSGKSTLLHRVLYNTWCRQQGQGGVEAGAVDAIEGLEVFEEVVLMSQSAIGRSSRSNALSYTKAYDVVRKLYSQTEHAQLEGLTMGDFSFNTPGGRCEHCQGAGRISVEMHFMADVEIICPECEGKRFTPRVLAARYRDKNIDDVLQMTVEEGMAFFQGHEALLRKLEPLLRVGLGYLRMGQSTTTLSGGEAQRLKLATYIAQGQRRGDERPSLFIFDEPTVGLHMHDVQVLLSALRQLVALGHTVLVIEHNTDFIAQADHIVDLGPGAGPEGGRVVASGPPQVIARCPESVTGRYLAQLLDLEPAQQG